MDSSLNLVGSENIILLSPKFSHFKESLSDILQEQDLQDHVVFLSSGTTSSNPKGYVISKKAMLSNAKAVNEHLGLTVVDQWGLTLPPYHVGGLSVYFRASLLNHAPTLLSPWRPEELVQKISDHKVTVISLVPTQIYDLVKLEIKAPNSLKYVLAGGDFLSMSLEQKALDLGWPILRTFGMSELGSQIATANQIGDKSLKILPIHQLETDEEKRLWIKSPSLYSFEIQFRETWILSPSSSKFNHSGYYPLPDRGEIQDGHLSPLGRHDGKIKSSGLLIDFFKLKEILEGHMLQNGCWGKMELVAQEDERKSQTLRLEYDDSVSFEIIENFKNLIHPIKIDEFTLVESIQRNELGKRVIQGRLF